MATAFGKFLEKKTTKNAQNVQNREDKSNFFGNRGLPYTENVRMRIDCRHGTQQVWLNFFINDTVVEKKACVLTNGYGTEKV